MKEEHSLMVLLDSARPTIRNQVCQGYIVCDENGLLLTMRDWRETLLLWQ